MKRTRRVTMQRESISRPRTTVQQQVCQNLSLPRVPCQAAHLAAFLMIMTDFTQALLPIILSHHLSIASKAHEGKIAICERCQAGIYYWADSSTVTIIDESEAYLQKPLSSSRSAIVFPPPGLQIMHTIFNFILPISYNSRCLLREVLRYLAGYLDAFPPK